MKKNWKKMITLLMVFMMMFAISMPVFAASDADSDKATVAEASSLEVTAEGTQDNTKGSKAIAAAIAVGFAAAAGAIGMGWAIAKSAEGIARQPEAEGNIRTTLMLGLVFIETAIIYALVVAILIIFVL